MNWHTDGPINTTSGSFILYLNKKWAIKDGGILELGVLKNNNIKTYKKIIPIFNRIVILKTEKDISWHRVTKNINSNNRIFIHDQLLKL